MIRELKQSNEWMMKTMNEQFAQLALSNWEREIFPSQAKVNPREDCSSPSFDLSDIRKLNVMTSSQSGKKVDIPLFSGICFS